MKAPEGGIFRLRLPRLLKTSALRLALRYVLGYTLLLGLVLGAFAWSTHLAPDPEVEAGLRGELEVLSQAFDAGGDALLAQRVASLSAASGGDGIWSLLLSPDGDRRTGTLLRWPDAGIEDGRTRRIWIEDKAIPRAIHDDDAYCVVLARTFADGSRVLLARHDPAAERLRDLIEYLGEGLAAVVLLALALGVGLGHSILRRMDAIGRTAEDIAGGDLSQRIPLRGGDDEFELLALRLNAMLDRIQQLVRGMREVTDNIAHDLRSPLTRLRNRLEVSLLAPRSDPEYRQSITHSLDDADAVIRTFNALLDIAQAEAGSRRGAWEPLDLAGIVRDVVELYLPLAEEKGQTVEIVGCERSTVAGSRDLLAQVLGNLLDNAVKYTPAGGAICLRLSATADTAEVSVADNGPGIPACERRRVLERFVRLDGSRNAPGNGLGLALVQAVAQLHRAELKLEDAGPGLRVILVFARHASVKPLSPAPFP